MKNNKGSLAALVNCFVRGYHTLYSNHPIFDDHIANNFLKEEEKTMIANVWSDSVSFFDPEKSNLFKNDNDRLKWIMNIQCIPVIVTREKYTEDSLALAIQKGVKQYVILGAGFDTFAFRQISLPEDFIIYEVDYPLIQALKLNRMEELNMKIPKHLKFISADFTTDSLRTGLKKQGFDEQKLSFFSLLGNSMYFGKGDFFKLLSFVANITPNGSSFIFDYLEERALDTEVASKRITQIRDIIAKSGELIITGFDPLNLDIELQKYNMLVYENLSPENIEERYFNNREDGLHALDHVHFAHLKVNK